MKPEFWSDEKLAPLDPVARLTFLGLLSMADDAGRLVDNLKQIDAFIFPETNDSARDALAVLEARGRIRRGLTASGQRVLQIVNWHHQKIDRPNLASCLPPIGGEPTEARSSNARRTVDDNSTNVRRGVDDVSSTHTSTSISTNDRRSASGSGAHARDAPPTEPPTEPPGVTTDPPALPDDLLADLPDDSPLRSASLAPLVRRVWLERYADAAPAAPSRWADVVRQLGELLTPTGTVARRRPREVVSATPAVLARAIEHALAAPIRDPDKTILVILRKCMSGDAVQPPNARGELPAEAHAAEQRAAAAADDAVFAARQCAADAWLAAHPNDRAPLEQRVAEDIPGGELSDVILAPARAARLVQLVEERQAALRDRTTLVPPVQRADEAGADRPDISPTIADVDVIQRREQRRDEARALARRAAG